VGQMAEEGSNSSIRRSQGHADERLIVIRRW
jgi:hypothetical protein